MDSLRQSSALSRVRSGAGKSAGYTGTSTCNVR